MTNLASARNHLQGCACCGISGLSRRQFVAGTLAIGAAAAWSGGPTPALALERTLIDTHHHFYPPGYQKLWLDYEDQRKIPHFAGQVAWSKQNMADYKYPRIIEFRETLPMTATGKILKAELR